MGWPPSDALGYMEPQSIALLLSYDHTAVNYIALADGFEPPHPFSENGDTTVSLS